MKVFVGLGNPGPQYIKTFHNLGFIALDHFAATNKLAFKDKKNYSYSDILSVKQKNYLLKPLTYMNLSGDAVQSFLSFHKIETDDICVILDDVSLPLGSIRIRDSGSDGGHKGLRDIILKLGTDKIKRIRLGCGPVPSKMELERYVLMNIPSEQKLTTIEMMNSVTSIINDLIEGQSISLLMNRYNRKTSEIPK